MAETDNNNFDAINGNGSGAGRTPGRYAYEGLERVIHEKARLSILSSLASNEAGLLFNDLKALCSLTDGNLSRHLQVLQEAELVDVFKGQQPGRPQTLVRLSAVGRKEFLEYLEELQRVIQDAKSANLEGVDTASGFAPA